MQAHIFFVSRRFLCQWSGCR